MSLSNNPHFASTPNRLLKVLFVGQGLALLVIFTTTAISSITGTHLAGTARVAGWPSTATLIGGSLAAYPIGYLMHRFGRRVGLSLGYIVGILGGIVAGIGVIAQSLLVFLIGMMLLGAARAASDQSRYAAADVSTFQRRARNVSLIVFAGTIGAVFGPALAPIADRAAQSIGLPLYAGPWFISALLFIAPLIVINLLLRPDPRDIGKQLATNDAGQDTVILEPARSLFKVLADPSARVALIALACAQMVMVMVMNITPIHMIDHAHVLEDVSFVISAHILGMYGLSMVTGWLCDRIGRRAMIGVGGVMLIAACALAPTNVETLPLAASLFLLGLGWNCCFVAGSSLLTDQLRHHERARVQGTADLVVSVSSAIGSLSSGELMARVGFQSATTIGMGLALIIVAASLTRMVSIHGPRAIESGAIEEAASQ
jgi:MFS family permease